MNINPNVIRAFEEAPVCFLATCQDGAPNVVPVGFKWIEGDRVLLADLFFGKTRSNLAANPQVAVAVGLLNPKRGFQVKGKAKAHHEGPVYDRVCELLRAHGVEARPAAALEIAVEQIFALDPGAQAGVRIA